MKATGIVLLLMGLLLVVGGIGMFVGGFLLFGSFAKSAMESRVAGSLPLTPGQTATSDPIMVNREKMCQIVLQVDLSGTDVKRTTQGNDDVYHLDYNLPLECEVFDDAGQSIHRESSTLAGSGFRSFINSSVDQDGGSETVRMMLGTFQAPASGKLSATAKLGANIGGDVEVEAAQLDVLDNVSASGAAAASGMGMCCGAPAVVGLGLVLLLVGAIITLASRASAPPPPPPGGMAPWGKT